MKIYDLNQDEQFIVECLREFHFLNSYGYFPSEFALYKCRSEYSVTFNNYMLSRKIEIKHQEPVFGLDVVFTTKTFWKTKTVELSKIAKLYNFPATLKALAELVQSDYMYLINPKQ